METVNDILKEMRDADGVDSSGWFTQKHVLDWADRIKAAYNFEKLEMKADQEKAENVIIEKTNKVIALTNANAELQNCVTGTCERRTLGIGLCACCPFGENDLLKDENAKLKAALKPVLAVTPSAWTADPTDRLSLGEYHVPVYDGKLCEAAVLEAQRIYKEGESK